jgi:hypothetical protein
MVKTKQLGPVSNGGERMIEHTMPYSIAATIVGTADFLFHRWNVESVAEKAGANKGSKAKKTDDIESFVYRNDAGELCIPGEYFRQSMIHAAKFLQDPRSPRKSAMDLFKAGIVVNTILCSLGKREWDYEDQRRVVIQRNGITRTRPAMKAGWKVDVSVMVQLPHYINDTLVHEVLSSAGKVIGVGDFRPTYGRFQVHQFEIE